MDDYFVLSSSAQRLFDPSSFLTKEFGRRILQIAADRSVKRASVVDGRVDGGATGKREYHGKAHEIVPRTGEGSGSLRARLPGLKCLH